MSDSPADCRLSEHHPSFLEVVGDFTDMYFRVHFHSFYDLSVINYCCFSQPIRSSLVADVAGSFQTLDFSMPFVFPIVLIDFLFSFSIQIACFSFRVGFLVSFWFVCVINECKIQNTEVINITDTTHSLLLISEELMQQDTAEHLERPVRQLFQYLCSHQIGG